MTTPEMTVSLYEEIEHRIVKNYKEIKESFADDSIKDAREHHVAGCIIRFVGHDFMDFRTANNNPDGTGEERGGSDACMDLNDDDNNGLANCATEFKFTDIYEQFCDKISLADYLIVAANALTGHLANRHG